MSVSGIGSSVVKEYAALYNNQAVASRHKAEEVKASAKTDSVVKTRQREEAVPIYTERTSQSGNLAQQDRATTFPIPSIIAKYEKYTKVIDCYSSNYLRSISDFLVRLNMPQVQKI